jgi:protein SCO1/2
MHMNMQDHQHHHDMAMSAPVTRMVMKYSMPDVRLTREDGKSVDFSSDVHAKTPVILAFIYTSCTTVCPVTSQILAETRELIAKSGRDVRIMSVSIDPEYDTPARLKAYGQKFGADAKWHHYTGSVEASAKVQKAFSAYRGDKMNHFPAFYINDGTGSNWVQLEGFPSAAKLASEVTDIQNVSSR